MPAGLTMWVHSQLRVVQCRGYTVARRRDGSDDGRDEGT
jgi:hypothetical protein